MTKVKRMPFSFYLQQEDITKLKHCLLKHKAELYANGFNDYDKVTLSNMIQIAIDEMYYNYQK